MKREIELLLNEDVLSLINISGGCIGTSYKVKTDKNTYFIKKYSTIGISNKEANGLKELSKSKTIIIPNVIKITDNILVLSYIRPGSPSGNFQKKLGSIIANLHMVTSTHFGFYEDNYIGSSFQKNTSNDNWIDFYINNRLDYQIELVKRNGYNLIVESYQKLRPYISQILSGQNEPPVLIHGDLWSGNVMSDEYGHPVIFDPAVYYGNREMELVMTRLFGGFTSGFYHSYNEAHPLKKGWQERQKIYTLYHILNHLNIFGSSYHNRALELINYYL